MTPYKTPYISSDEKLFVQIQNSGRSLNILYSKKIWQSFPYVKLGLKTWRGSFHAVLQPKILNSFFLTQFPQKKATEPIQLGRSDFNSALRAGSYHSGSYKPSNRETKDQGPKVMKTLFFQPTFSKINKLKVRRTC